MNMHSKTLKTKLVRPDKLSDQNKGWLPQNLPMCHPLPSSSTSLHLRKEHLLINNKMCTDLLFTFCSFYNLYFACIWMFFKIFCLVSMSHETWATKESITKASTLGRLGDIGTNSCFVFLKINFKTYSKCITRLAAQLSRVGQVPFLT